MEKESRVVVITGAAQGLGRCTAEYFREHGDRLALLDYNLERLEAWAGDLEGVAVYQADVTNMNRLREIADDIMERFGQIDVLVNCAGKCAPQRPFEEWTEEAWRDIMDTNITGVFLCTQAFGQKMLDRGGAIVNFSSVAGLIPSPGRAPYPVSKAGVISLTQQTAISWGGRGVRCNCVCPGTIKTEMAAHFFADEKRAENKKRLFSVGRFGEPMDVAQAVYTLASPEMSFVNGEFVRVDGGFTLSPLIAFNLM